MPADRVHNEWFRPVSCGGRKSCPTCKASLGRNESIWSWGNYIRAKWRTIGHFCRECYREEVCDKLLGHTDDCGCSVTLVGYQCVLPKWLRLIRRRQVCQLATTPPMNTEDAAAFKLMDVLASI